MNRRRFLGSVGGGIGLSLLGTTTAFGTTGTQEGYEPHGVAAVPGARDAAVHHDGEVAYVAAGDGFAAVDISDPEDPTVIAERRDIETGGEQDIEVIWDVWPWEDRLAVVGPAQPAPGTAQGLALFDISDPSDPEQVAWHGTDFYIHNSFFDDGVVYLTGSSLPENPLVMVDVEGDEPEEIARWSLLDAEPEWGETPLPGRVLHDVYVQDEIAYLPYWNAGTWIVDVSDPTDPDLLSRVGDYTLEDLLEFSIQEAQVEAFIPPGNAHYAQVNEDASILLVGKETWATRDPDDPDEILGGPGGVDLWDISDKESPEHLAHVEAPESFDNTQEGWFTTAHNCDIVGDRMYSSWYYGGVKIHDISDPESPEEIAWWRNPREASFWTAQSAVPGETFVGSSTNLGQTFDVPNETTAGLYVFPDRAGTQEDAPGLTERPEDLVGPEETPTPTPVPNGTPTPSPTPEDTRNPTATPTPTPVVVEHENADDDGPGFGVAGAVAGIGGVSYAVAKRYGVRDSEE